MIQELYDCTTLLSVIPTCHLRVPDRLLGGSATHGLQHPPASWTHEAQVRIDAKPEQNRLTTVSFIKNSLTFQFVSSSIHRHTPIYISMSPLSVALLPRIRARMPTMPCKSVAFRTSKASEPRSASTSANNSWSGAARQAPRSFQSKGVVVLFCLSMWGCQDCLLTRWPL